MARVAVDPSDTLLSVLTGAELHLIGQTLRLRLYEAERRRDNTRLFAASLTNPESRRVYQSRAAADDLEIEKLTVIIDRTPLW